MARQRKRPSETAGIKTVAVTGNLGGGAGGNGGDEPGDEEDLEQMHRQYTLGSTEGSKNRERAEGDDEFLLGMNQWEPRQKRQREAYERPTLTVNKLPSSYHNVLNDMRQSLPGIQILPEDDLASAETAAEIEGHLRYIEHRSFGIEHRMTALAQAVAGGYGYYRVNTVYASDRGFELEPRIEPVPNRSAVVDDPAAVQPDWSDRRFLFLLDRVTKADAEKLYPENEWEDSAGLGDKRGLTELWQGEYRPVIEWWTRDITDWETVETEEKDADGKPVRSREVPVYTVKWAFTNGAEFLKDRRGRPLRGTWEGPWIPFMRVDGWKLNLKGKWHVEGLGHQAHDTQRLYNYSQSSMAEHFGLASKVPWEGPAQAFEGYEDIWRTANTVPHSYLPWKPVPMGGVILRPQRVDPPPAPPTLAALIQTANNDLRDTLGMYAAGVGAPTNDPSGYAQQQRRAENDVNHYHFMAGLAVAMQFEARVLIALLPKIYDTPRTIRTRSEEGRLATLKVNEPPPDSDKEWSVWPAFDTEGRPVRHHDLRVGTYGVVIQLGASFATQNEQAVDGMDKLMGRLPPTAAAVLAPFYARAAHWRDHEKIAQLLTAMLPPELQALMNESEGGSAEQDVRKLRNQVAQAQAVTQQMGAMIQQLQKAVQDKQGELAVKALAAAAKEVTQRLSVISHVKGQQIRGEAEIIKEGMRRGQHAAAAGGVRELDEEADEALAHMQNAGGQGRGGQGGGGQGGGGQGGPPAGGQ